MFNRLGFEKVYCGLDIGDQSVKAAVIKGNAQNGHWEILGIFEQPTWGYKEGAVTDLADFSECIAQTLNQLGQKVGVKIKDVSIGIGPSVVQARSVNTVIPLVERGSKIITSKDIEKVDQQARMLGIEMDEDLIHDLPLRYQVDAAQGIRNPLGLYGRKLGVQSIMVVSPTNRVRNITKAVNQAGYEVHELCFGNYLTHGVTVADEEKNKGVLVVDFGASSTTVLLFQDSLLAFYERIPLGGAHLTKALAEALQISFDLAEEIKQSYGDLLMTDFSNDEEILVKKENAYLPIRREAIYQALSKTSSQLFSGIVEALVRSGLRDQANCGAVLVGGGAALNGLIESFEQHVHIPARIGRLELATAPSIQRVARFLTVLAVAKSAFEDRSPMELQEEGNSWVKQVSCQLRNLYQEYF